MDKQKLMRKTWAILHDLWEKDVGYYIIHCFIIARFGLESMKELSEEQLSITIDWLDSIGEQK